MTQKIGALSIDLQAESAAFQRDMRRATATVQASTQRMERDLQGVTRGLAGVDAAFSSLRGGAARLTGALGALGVGISAMGFVQLIRGALDSAGGLGELAEQAGTTTDALQILTAAGAAAGVSAEQVQDAFGKLTRKIGEAGDGSEEAFAAFANLGIAFRNADGSLRATESVLADVAEVLKNTEDPAERARIAVDLFGRSGQRLLPILSQGRAGLVEFERAARAAGLVLGGDVITSADKAGDRIAEVVLRFTRLQQVVAAGLSPAILQGLEKIETVLTNIRTAADNPSITNLLRLIAQGAGGALQNAPSYLPGGAGAQTIGRGLSSIGGATTELQDAEAALAGLQQRQAEAQRRLAAATAPDQIARLQTSVERLNGQITEAEGKVTRLRGTAAPAPTFSPDAPTEPDIPLPPPDAPTPPRRTAGSAPQPQVAAYIAQLQQQAAAQVAELALIDETAGARAAATAILEAESRARDDAAKGLRSSVSLTEAERAAITAAARARANSADAERKLNDARTEAARVTEAARTESEKLADQVARLNVLLREGLITQETYNRSVHNLENPARSAGNEMARFGDIAGSAFEDAVIDGERFADVLRGIEKDLLRLGTRAFITQPAGDFLTGLSGGGGGGGGGSGSATIAGLAKLAATFFGGGGGGGVSVGDGSMDAAMFAGISGMATGGPAYAGRIYEIGERGRELFVPPVDGEIIPNHELREMERGSGRGGRAGSGDTINVTMPIYTNDGDSFRRSQGQILGDANRGIARGQRNA